LIPVVYICPICEGSFDPAVAAADVVGRWVLARKIGGPLTPDQAALVDDLKRDLGIED
jgi:hypothetical protein